MLYDAISEMVSLSTPYHHEQGNISWGITASTILQTIYLAKFYYWEDGYMSTIDIAVDKFGFYVGWGCIAWVLTALFI